MEVVILEKNKKNEEKQKYRSIIEEVKKAFSDTSNNYRQKLVFNLLNTIRENNQKEFFWMTLRALNARSNESEIGKLSKEIGEMYPLNSYEFEKLAYSVILGIMSVEPKGGD